MRFITEIQSWFHTSELISVIYYYKTKKNKHEHMTIIINTEKYLTKSDSFLNKTLRKLGIKGIFFKLIKSTLKNKTKL